MNPDDPICDFCLKPEVSWTHVIAPFTLVSAGGRPYVDDGEWAVCHDCHLCIYRGDWLALRDRATVGNIVKLGTLTDEDSEHLELLLAAFAGRYNGMYYEEPVH